MTDLLLEGLLILRLCDICVDVVPEKDAIYAHIKSVLSFEEAKRMESLHWVRDTSLTSAESTCWRLDF